LVVSEQILTIPEVTLEPVTSSSDVDYQTRTLREHAIRVTDGIGEPTSLCGEFVHGDLLDVPFETTRAPIRCARCADLLGLDHAGG
jgi:hypothetical protein